MKKVCLRFIILFVISVLSFQLSYGQSSPKIDSRFDEAKSLIEKNDTLGLLKLLKSGLKGNCSYNEGGNTLLIESAEAGTPAIMKILIAYGADPGVCNSYGYIPLEAAFNKKKYDNVEYLLSLNAELFFTDKRIKKAGKNPWDYQMNDANRNIIYGTISSKRYDFLLSLIKKGFNINKYYTLIYACYAGDYEAAKMLLDHGVDGNIIVTPDDWVAYNHANIPVCTPLYAAARGGNRDLIKLMLNSKTVIESTEEYHVNIDARHVVFKFVIE